MSNLEGYHENTGGYYDSYGGYHDSYTLGDIMSTLGIGSCSAH